MFTPTLIEGTVTCRSIFDPAIRFPTAEATDGLQTAAIAKAADIGRAHRESCGTAPLPCEPGERISEFEVRLLDPLAARPAAIGDDAEAYCLEWYKLCCISLDGDSSKEVLLKMVPRQVMVEIGGYASRLNSGVSRPFSKSSPPKPSGRAAGSTGSAKSKSRKTGTRNRT
jgi:hypothetical protein